MLIHPREVIRHTCVALHGSLVVRMAGNLLLPRGDGRLVGLCLAVLNFLFVVIVFSVFRFHNAGWLNWSGKDTHYFAISKRCISGVFAV